MIEKSTMTLIHAQMARRLKSTIERRELVADRAASSADWPKVQHSLRPTLKLEQEGAGYVARTSHLAIGRKHELLEEYGVKKPLIRLTGSRIVANPVSYSSEW